MRGRRTLRPLTQSLPRAGEGGDRVAPDGTPINCAAVEKHRASKFGDALEPTRAAMVELAASIPAVELDRKALRLYEAFRPEIPAGAGKAGELDWEKARGARCRPAIDERAIEASASLAFH